MKIEKSCGVIMFRKDPLRFLILKRSDNARWEFCKGHQKKGETEVETAHRELKEELGVMVDLDDGFREEVRYVNSKGNTRVLVFFLAQLTQDITLSKEHSEYLWVADAHDYGKAFLADLLKKASIFIENESL